MKMKMISYSIDHRVNIVTVNIVTFMLNYRYPHINDLKQKSKKNQF